MDKQKLPLSEAAVFLACFVCLGSTVEIKMVNCFGFFLNIFLFVNLFQYVEICGMIFD